MLNWHKRLIWIHAPAMLLTAVSGILAHKSYKDGKKTTGLGDKHSTLTKIASIPFFISFGLTLYEF
jgi:(p)ppGpp synthase/HD superfamily hydrolase